MVDMVSMINHTPEGFGLLHTPLRGLNESPKHQLAQAPTDSLELGLSAKNAQSFTVEILVVQVSMQISTRTGATAPTQGEFSPLDFSPEATAQRVFDFSMSVFAVYQTQNPDQPAEFALADFEQLVRDAIDEGFGEARRILDDSGMLDGTIGEFIDRTYSVLEQLLDAFFQGENPGQLAKPETLADGTELSWTHFELEYQYLYLEGMRGPHELSDPSHVPQNTGRGIGAGDSIGNTRPTKLLQFQAESLRVAFNYAQEIHEPSFQLVV